MKKMILIALIPITFVTAGSFVMSKGNPLIKADTTTIDTGTDTTTTYSDWTPADLPTQKFNVLEYGLKGDGTTDDSNALNELAKNTNVTNWYFPAGYTFLIKNIKIPTHLKAIFGGGKIRAKANTSSNGSAGGPILFTHTINGIIIDNLYFEAENKPYPGSQADKENGVVYPNYWPYEDHGYVGPSGNLWRMGGHILIDGFNNKNNIEIRNCTFDMTHFKYSGIKGFGNKAGGGGGKLTNLHIHHNDFKNYGEFGIEIIDLERVPDGSGHNVTGLRINNNTMYNNGGGMAISLVLLRAGVGNTGKVDGTENRVYENIVDNASWALEYSGSSGLYVYNNKFTNIKKKMFLASQGWKITAIGKNFIYNNHLTEKYIGYETQWSINNNDEYYGNYISGHIIINEGKDDLHDYFGNFHDNTIVLNNSASTWTEIMIINKRHNGIIANNDFYAGSNVSRGVNFPYNAGGSNTIIKNNKFHMKKNTAICVDDSNNQALESGTVCNKGWTGTIPISRPGAGLSN